LDTDDSQTLTKKTVLSDAKTVHDADAGSTLSYDCLNKEEETVGLLSTENATRNSAILPPESGGKPIDFVGVPRARYAELDILGAGGMGEVFLARDEDIGREVAVKKLHQKSTASVNRFIREIRSLGSLEHPGIVPIHDVGMDEDGRLFFVMKRLDGETLAQVIDGLKRGLPGVTERMTYHERYRICQAILSVMSFAHAQGFLHRDLKPDNIMIGHHGEVVIVDWGLATKVGDEQSAQLDVGGEVLTTRAETASTPFVTQDGTIIGTPQYMSPEQAAGETKVMDHRSDLYSLATIFYELFTLKHPLDLEGKAVIPLLMAVVEAPPTLAYMHEEPVHGRIPSELAYFLDKGLKKDPAHRYQSAEEMSEEMQMVQSGNFCVVCPSTLVRRSLYAGLEKTSRSPLLMVPLLYGITGFSLFTMVYFFVAVL
jgi:eukaryotic-like serine/threonine-protein kinase